MGPETIGLVALFGLILITQIVRAEMAEGKAEKRLRVLKGAHIHLHDADRNLELGLVLAAHQDVRTAKRHVEDALATDAPEDSLPGGPLRPSL